MDSPLPPLLLIQSLVLARCIFHNGKLSTQFKEFLEVMEMDDVSRVFKNHKMFCLALPFIPSTMRTRYTYDVMKSLTFLLKKSASDIAVLADLPSRTFPAFRISRFGGTTIKFDLIDSFIPYNLMKPFTVAMNMNLLKGFYVQAF